MMGNSPSPLEELAPDVLREIMEYLTPIERSRLGMVSKWMLGEILKILGVKNMKEHVGKWECDICGIPVQLLYHWKYLLACDHEVAHLCVGCMASFKWRCKKCNKKGPAICGRCRHSGKIEISVCEHGWIQQVCVEGKCVFPCKGCNWITRMHGNGTKCGYCGAVGELPPGCLCEYIVEN
jgi:hypothetical protein